MVENSITYYYPADLNKPPMFFLWKMRDFILTAIFAFISIAIIISFLSVIPLAATAVYAFMTLHINGEISIYQYARRLTHYFVTQQQRFYWR